MLDHIGIIVSDLNRSSTFYSAALRPLAFRGHTYATSASRSAVDEFFTAALVAGGKGNGGPALRSQYHPCYYAAFILDPDGYNIEAVCHLSD